MRHKFVTENAPLRCLKTPDPVALKRNPPLQRTEGALHLLTLLFLSGRRGSCDNAMEDGREPEEELGDGGGARQRVTITEQTQAGQMDGYFRRLAPGTRREFASRRRVLTPITGARTPGRQHKQHE